MKYFTGTVAGIVGFFAPVGVLVLCAAVFVLVNFATGMLADRRRARLRGRPWAFDTRRAWRTVHKLWLVMAGIMMAWIIDGLVIDFAYLHLANLYTGFVCGVEFWSYLENAAEISDGRLFGRLGRFMKRRIFEQLGARDDETPGGSGRDPEAFRDPESVRTAGEGGFGSAGRMPERNDSEKGRAPGDDGFGRAGRMTERNDSERSRAPGDDGFGSAEAESGGRFVYSEDIDAPQSGPEGGVLRL